MCCTLHILRAANRVAAVLALSLALVACGDDAETPDDVSPDGGSDEHDGGPNEHDGGPNERDSGPDDRDGGSVAPTVLLTTPRNGQDEVGPTSSIDIVFSQAMDPAAGTVVVDGVEISVDEGHWSSGGRVWTVTPAEPLEVGAMIAVRVKDDFQDSDGVPLEEPYAFAFRVARAASMLSGPAVIETTPADGAADLGVDLGEVVVRFSEAMDTASGAVTLFGGGAVGAVEWVADDEATIQVSGLAGDSSYSLALDGFRNLAGVALDPVPELGDGRIDFSTGEDTVGPRVVASTPAEGDSAVPASHIREIALTFDEPMAQEGAGASLAGGPFSEPVALALEWDSSHEARLVVSEGIYLAYGAAYRVSLDGFEDAHGNVLQMTPYLEDGFLDFSAQDDSDAPQIISSQPFNDGAVIPMPPSDVQFDVVLQFDEPMSIEGATATVLRDGEEEATLDIYPMDDAASRFQITLGYVSLSYDASYQLVLSGFTDLAGNAIDASGYLGDGVLDFQVEPDTQPPFAVLTTGPIYEGRNIPSLPTYDSGAVVEFSEPMDPSMGTARLVRVDGDDDVELQDITADLYWQSDNHLIAAFDPTLLQDNQRYRIVLEGFVDLAGLPLDGTPALGNGAIDFSVGAPQVSWSLPIAGATDFFPLESVPDPETGERLVRTRLALRFDEAMDEAFATVTLVEVATERSREIEGTWTIAGDESELEVIVPYLQPPGEDDFNFELGSEYLLVFDQLRDADGMPVALGAPLFPGAALRFKTVENDPRLSHACGHVTFDRCEPVTAFAVVSPFAPITAQGHIQYAVTLPADGGSGYAGYTSLESIDDQATLTIYLRESAAVTITELNSGYQVPFEIESVPPFCGPLVTYRYPNACAQLGEAGITRRLRVRLPQGGTYLARWGATQPVIHYIAEFEFGSEE